MKRAALAGKGWPPVRRAGEEAGPEKIDPA